MKTLGIRLAKYAVVFVLDILTAVTIRMQCILLDMLTGKYSTMAIHFHL